MHRPAIPSPQVTRCTDIHEQAVGYSPKSTQEALRTVISLAEAAIDAGLHISPSYLTSSLPDELSLAVNSVKRDFVGPDYRFRQELNDSEDRKILTWLSRETNIPIIQIAVFHPSSERISYRVDFSYRAPDGEMSLGARLRSRDDNLLAVKYRDPDSSELRETTREPSAAADRIRGPLSHFSTQAFERWGYPEQGEHR